MAVISGYGRHFWLRQSFMGTAVIPGIGCGRRARRQSVRRGSPQWLRGDTCPPIGTHATDSQPPGNSSRAPPLPLVPPHPGRGGHPEIAADYPPRPPPGSGRPWPSGATLYSIPRRGVPNLLEGGPLSVFPHPTISAFFARVPSRSPFFFSMEAPLATDAAGQLIFPNSQALNGRMEGGRSRQPFPDIFRHLLLLVR